VGSALSVPSNTSETFVTTLVSNDTEATTLVTEKPTDVSMSIIDGPSQFGTQSVVEYLSKLSLISDGAFTTTDSGRLYTATIPDVFFSVPKNRYRLSGVGYVRGDFEFILQVNAVRFQQGRYILAYLPISVNANTVQTNLWIAAHVVNTQAITSLRHVEIDLATQTSVTLKIPWQGPFNYTNVNFSAPSQFPPGIIFIYPYSPLQAGSGDTTCAWTLYGRMENVKTYANVVAQSSKSIQFAEAGSKLGPISSVARKISLSATELGVLPMLTSMMSVVSWGADVAGNVAKIWGYSKPMNANPALIHTRKTVPNSFNSDGAFNGHGLGLSSSNEVALTTGRSRTQIDEMSYKFLCSQYIYWNSVTWSTAAVSETLLYSTAVGPHYFNTTYGKGTTAPVFSTLSYFHAFYRGGFKFKFKIVKTEFHSGRLLVSFLPQLAFNTGGAAVSFADTDNLFREIIDIRETNEFEVVVPYIQPTNFLIPSFAIGTLSIHIVNALVAPSTVTSSVQILMEVAAADDFELAGAIGSQTGTTLEPYIPAVSQSAKKIQLAELGSLDTSNDFAAESIGCKTLSLRQLLKRPIFLGSFGGLGASLFQPFTHFPVLQTTSNSSPLVRTPDYISDLFGLFSMFYSSSSGGLRMHLNDGTTSSLYSVVITQTSGNAQSYMFTGGYATYYSSATGRISANIEGVAMLEIPGYTVSGGRSSLGHLGGTNTIITGTLPLATNGGATVAYIFNSPSGNTVSVDRYVADDFNFHTFAGIVPWVLNTTT